MATHLVFEIRKTEDLVGWLDGRRDVRARARVQARIERLAGGNPGDVQAVGEREFQKCGSIMSRATGYISKESGAK